MKNPTLPLLLAGGAAVAAYLILAGGSKSDSGGGGGGTSDNGGLPPKPTLILPRLAPTAAKTVTVLTVDTNGLVREVIPQAWSGASSVIELVILNAKTGVPVTEAVAFPRDQYDFKTLPAEVMALLQTYFNVQWAA